MLRAGAAIFFGWGSANFLSLSAPSSGDSERPETKPKGRWVPVFMLLPLVLLIVAALAVGVVPQVREVAVEAAERFTDTAGYRAAVLEGLPQPTGTRGLVAAPGQAMGVAGVLLALILAAATLFMFRLPERVLQSAERLISPAIRLFRGLHSGYIGDYVTWFIIGAALLIFAGCF